MPNTMQDALADEFIDEWSIAMDGLLSKCLDFQDEVRRNGEAKDGVFKSLMYAAGRLGLVELGWRWFGVDWYGIYIDEHMPASVRKMRNASMRWMMTVGGVEVGDETLREIINRKNASYEVCDAAMRLCFNEQGKVC